MDKLRDEIVSCVRACLTSAKGQSDVRQLQRDFRQLVGYEIPFRKLGFDSLVSFLQSEKSLMVNQRGSEYFVAAKLDERSRNLVELINKQKTTGKKKKLKPIFKTNAINHPKAPNRWRPANVNRTPYSDKKNMENRRMQTHNQFHVRSPMKSRPAALAQQYPAHAQQHPTQQHAAHAQQHPAHALLPAGRRHDETTVLRTHNNNNQVSHKSAYGRAPDDFNATRKAPQNGVNRDSVNRDDKDSISRDGVVAARDGSRGKVEHKQASEDGATRTSADNRKVHSDRTNRSTVLANLALRQSPTIGSTTAWNVSLNTSSSENEAGERQTAFLPTGDHIVDLVNFAKFWRLSEPVVTVKDRTVKGRRPVVNYDCKIKGAKVTIVCKVVVAAGAANLVRVAEGDLK